MKKSKFEKVLKEAQNNLKELLDCVHELNVNVKEGSYFKERLGVHYSDLNHLSNCLSDLENGAKNQSNPENYVFGLNQVIELEDDE